MHVEDKQTPRRKASVEGFLETSGSECSGTCRAMFGVSVIFAHSQAHAVNSAQSNPLQEQRAPDSVLKKQTCSFISAGGSEAGSLLRSILAPQPPERSNIKAFGTSCADSMASL